MTARKEFCEECRLEVGHPEVMEPERPSGASAARAVDRAEAPPPLPGRFPYSGEPGLDRLGGQGVPSQGPTLREQLSCLLLDESPFDQRPPTELGVEEMHGDGLRRHRAVRERGDAKPAIRPPHERLKPGIIDRQGVPPYGKTVTRVRPDGLPRRQVRIPPVGLVEHRKDAAVEEDLVGLIPPRPELPPVLLRRLQQTESRLQAILVGLCRLNVPPQGLPRRVVQGDAVALPVERVRHGAGKEVAEPFLDVHWVLVSRADGHGIGQKGNVERRKSPRSAVDILRSIFDIPVATVPPASPCLPRVAGEVFSRWGGSLSCSLPAVLSALSRYRTRRFALPRACRTRPLGGRTYERIFRPHLVPG